MSLEEKKIRNYEDNIKSLSDYPSEDGVSAEQLKAMFDGRGDKEIKNAVNGIIDELAAPAAASQIGSYEGNIQRELDLKAEIENPYLVGKVTVDMENGEGLMELTPATMGEQAQVKILDASGVCAALNMDFDGNLWVSYGNEYIEEKEAEGRVYTQLSHPNLDLAKANLTEEEKAEIRENIGVAPCQNPRFEGTICVGDAEIKNVEDKLVIYRPFDGVVPLSELTIGAELCFNGKEVFHRGNFKDLLQVGNTLDEFERDVFFTNTGLNTILGDVESALESIIAMQEGLIGGDAA